MSREDNLPFANRAFERGIKQDVFSMLFCLTPVGITFHAVITQLACCSFLQFEPRVMNKMSKWYWHVVNRIPECEIL